jgi:hypothetical protein
MMICPETYYEMNLKGKDEKQLLSAIRGLKNEIGHLKNVMEHPDYKNAPIMHPSETVRVSCTREYLARAIQALEEIGGTYQLSKAELKAKEFQDNLEYLSKITFEIGGFFDGITRYVIEFQGDKAGFISTRYDCILEEKPLDKEEVIWLLSRLYIGEWKKYYDPKRFGYFVLDGTQWNVSFEYSNGYKTVEFAGSNDYPYNFSEFIEIFGLDEDIEFEEDEE